MSTINQVSASRANGARSLGPVTPEGKKRSSMNAVRHGLLARCVVLDNESRECFDQLLAQFLDCFRPANDVEFGMIEEMIAACWRQRRAWAIETSLLDIAISKEPGGDELIRMFQHALKNLLLLRTIELPNEPDIRIELPNEPDIRPIDLPNTLGARSI